MSQITTLTIEVRESEIPWDKILTEPTATLTRLTAKCDLTDGLLVRLLHQAPCLQRLSVSKLQLQSEQHREQVSS